jgi:hypothetical protein
MSSPFLHEWDSRSADQHLSQTGIESIFIMVWTLIGAGVGAAVAHRALLDEWIVTMAVAGCVVGGLLGASLQGLVRRK